MDTDPRIDELNEYAAERGTPLPFPAAQIAALEDAGHVVNLDTGAILLDYAEDFLNSTVALTDKGRAVYAALRKPSEVHP